MKIDLAHALVDLWARREEPVDHDVPTALNLAGALEENPNAPAYLRGFAWNVVDSMVRATSWHLPETEGLARCRGAAVSISHGTALLLHDIAAEINGNEAPVLVLGALGAGMSLFGRWDLLPASGAVLVPLDDSDPQYTLAPPTPGQQGVRWCRAGSLTDVLRRNSRRVDIGETSVRVPTAPLVAARISGPPWARGDISSFLFCAAAHEAIEAGQWDRVLPIARTLGRDASVREASVRLELEHWLDLHVPPMTKIATRFRQLVRPALHARIF